MQALRESDIGEGISDTAIEKIASISNLLSLDKGEVLTEEGAEGHHAYIILSGSIEVQLSADDPTNPATTRTLLPGSIIGEMSILENYRRTARTIAAEPSSLLCLLDEELWTVFDADPIAGYTFMRNLARILSKRLRVTNLAIRHSFFAE
jgi:CRP-like cAMP-binding protein